MIILDEIWSCNVIHSGRCDFLALIIELRTENAQIKTLRLATSYIAYLTGVLETDDPAGGFRAELIATGRKSGGQIQVNECSTGQISPKSDTSVSLAVFPFCVHAKSKAKLGLAV